MKLTLEWEPGELTGALATFGAAAGRILAPVAEEVIHALERPRKSAKKGK